MMKKGGLLFRACYHRVVSINRPSGYEPDALPLRHDDFFDMCPAVAHMSHSLHYVQINITINHLMIFTIIL